ncbi:protein YceG like [alpha proteobacterium U9-1i]|nr:protein YceG like [alpha proteobacterium U9-1i]
MARFRPVDRRRGGFWGFFSLLIGLGIIVAAAALVAVFAFNAEATRAGPAQADAAFTVERGQSAAAIGSALESQGLIRDALLFRIATRAFAQGQSLQAGEYEIEAGASLRDIVRKMAEGDVIDHSITFAEGITISGVMRIIGESEYLTGDLPEAPPEGSILPETYHVARGMTRAALLQQMRDARDAALAEIWEGRQPNLPITTPEELVTLASIVERETGVAAERPLVAAAFVNRLRRPMRLESDPTIIYGVCRQFPTRCRDGRLIDAQGNPRVIRASEIALRNPYNTYQIDRLPPTPIANPGRAALEATANPADSNAIFFVADGSGGHAFAATLAEHNANVARWRQIEAQRLAAERAGR